MRREERRWNRLCDRCTTGRHRILHQHRHPWERPGRNRNSRAKRGGVADYDLAQCVCRVAVERKLQSAMRAPVVAELARDPNSYRFRAFIRRLWLYLFFYRNITYCCARVSPILLKSEYERQCVPSFRNFNAIYGCPLINISVCKGQILDSVKHHNKLVGIVFHSKSSRPHPIIKIDCRRTYNGCRQNRLITCFAGSENPAARLSFFHTPRIITDRPC